jgi:dTDP-4-dehydrorhamnose 3,5-epimerase
MRRIETLGSDVFLIEPKVFGDARGFFYESWNRKSLAEMGLTVDFVQDNHSCSQRGVLRGLHYQIQHPQGKLVRVVVGEVFDVAVDLRCSSPGFGQAVGFKLSAENRLMAWIPPGFAHGFCVTSDIAEVLYKTTDYWYPEHERSLLWSDPCAEDRVAARRCTTTCCQGCRGCWAIKHRDLSMKISNAGMAGYVGLSKASSQRIHFCADWYLQTYPDVAAAGIDPLQHYLAYGRSEGRLPGENRGWLLEAKLWGGFSQWALDGLEGMLADAGARADERAYAAWVLAGWLAFQDNNWRRVAILAAQARAAGCPSHLGPLLLESDALRRAGRSIDARCLLRRTLTQQPNTPDLYLAYANAWSDGPNSRRLDWINRGLLAGGLTAVELRDLQLPLSLDNLVVAPAPADETFSQPKVSVIVPLRNAQATVVTALESVRRQTWRNIEVLVVDDCSTDGSFELVCELAKHDDRVVLLRHPTTLGTYAARNTGLARATGDFITTHDADDWSHPQKLALQVKALLSSPASQASVSNWVRCSSNLVFSQQHPQAKWVHCNASSLMFRRQVVETLGYWDAVTVGADAEYYYRILSVYGRKAIKEVLPGVPLAFGRHHPDSLTQRSETHARSLYYGLRREYQESFDAWHRQASRAGSARLPAQPLYRPFPAPVTILRQAPSKEFRRLVVADFSADSPQAARVEDGLRHLSGFGGQLAVFHLSDVTRPALGRVSENVRTLLREYGVITVLPGRRCVVQPFFSGHMVVSPCRWTMRRPCKCWITPGC